jgi:hypothetical protein
VYFRGGRHPTLWDRFRSWGPTGARFDHHEPPPRDQNRQILYAAAAGPTCLAEVFQDTRTINRSRAEPWLVGFELTRPVALLDLTSSWPTRAGASMAISTGPRPRARGWSRAIYDAYPGVDGLMYPSSMNASAEAVAMYERARDAMPRHPIFNRPLTDPALLFTLGNVAVDLGYRLI